MKRFRGSAMKSGFKNDSEENSFAMTEASADFFLFQSPELKGLLEMFPYLGDNARRAVQPAQNKYRIRLFYAPTI